MFLSNLQAALQELRKVKVSFSSWKLREALKPHYKPAITESVSDVAM